MAGDGRGLGDACRASCGFDWRCSGSGRRAGDGRGDGGGCGAGHGCRGHCSRGGRGAGGRRGQGGSCWAGHRCHWPCSGSGRRKGEWRGQGGACRAVCGSYWRCSRSSRGAGDGRGQGGGCWGRRAGRRGQRGRRQRQRAREAAGLSREDGQGRERGLVHHRSERQAQRRVGAGGHLRWHAGASSACMRLRAWRRIHVRQALFTTAPLQALSAELHAVTEGHAGSPWGRPWGRSATGSARARVPGK